MVSLSFNSLHVRIGHLLPPITGLPEVFKQDGNEARDYSKQRRREQSSSALCCDWLAPSSWGSLSPPKTE